MTTVLALASLALAACFLTAAVAKLLDRSGSREAARGFGVPARLASVVAVALPLAEIAIGVLLAVVSTRWWAATAAFGLLVVFGVAIGAAMARGSSPDCHCFGRLHSAPAGWSTLVRNAALAALAALVVVAGRHDAGPGVGDWASGVDASTMIVLALACALALAVAGGAYTAAHVLRSYGRVLVRLDRLEERLRAVGLELDDPDDVPQLGLAPGTAAPAFWLPSVEGGRVSLDDLLLPGRPALLLFTSPSCGPCSVLMPAVADWQREHAERLTIVLLSDGDPEAVRAEAAEHGLENVLVDETLSAYEAYGANGTPSAVLVGDDGTVASWLAAGGDWIETLVEQALEGLGRAPGLPMGTELPPLTLESLDGVEHDLVDLVSGPTVVLFWNPGCGFCHAMRDDVLAWEQDRPAEAPGLLVVSAGDAADIEAESFASIVLLDPDWSASGVLGAAGTPMAVLVDGDGRIASPLMTGADAVLGLLGVYEPGSVAR
jgi:methylamine dehydrogenase accessory protein MauD